MATEDLLSYDTVYSAGGYHPWGVGRTSTILLSWKRNPHNRLVGYTMS